VAQYAERQLGYCLSQTELRAVGSLAAYLQRAIPNQLPSGWFADTEVPLLQPAVTGLLGYDPRADVVLTHAATATRVWVEFEVSRADPVANHAKFATAHLFAAQGPADHFVAMLSPHIDRGRRNLAAATVRLMRRVGMSAFQTTLLPLAPRAEVRRLNQLPPDALRGERVDVAAEIERALAVVTPVGRWGRLDVDLVGDLLDALTNLRGWNDDLRTEAGRRAWGRRACQYFVYDATSRQFAPAKFCAYTPVHPAGGSEASPWHRMSAVAYAALNDGTHVMDGGRAHQHLALNLGMRAVARGEAGEVAGHFQAWLAAHPDVLTVRGGEPTLLLLPTWYARG
jgi:hypothetical protein